MFRQSFYFLLLIYLVTVSSCKNNKEHDLAIKKKETVEARKLLKYYFIHELKLKTIILSEVPVKFKNIYCIERIIAKHKSLALEAQEVLDKSEKDSTLWTSAISTEFQILSKVQVEKLQVRGGTDDLTKMGGFYNVSLPAFSKDFKFAIIESIFYCGDRCGSANALLFESKNGNWNLIGKYCPLIF